MSAGGWSKARLGRMREVMAGYVGRGKVPGLVTLVSRRGDVHVDAVTIAQLRSTTRPHCLSLTDRACLATGFRLGLTVLTADRAWENLSLQTVIRIIR